jgi:HlyD family secretion protein
MNREAVKTQLAVQEALLEQGRAVVVLRQQEVDQLRVRAGMRGVVQQLAVEVGQQVTPGLNLARVADMARLKAEVRIAETQTKDIGIGQVASIDTRNGIIPGRVIRIDPASQNGTVAVDVALEGELPKGARPDMSVDGTIELERLDDVLFVQRPAFGQEKSTITLFKLDPDGQNATRTQVTLGRSSVTTIEIISGLQVGDRVILSDTSQWDNVDRIRLN